MTKEYTSFKEFYPFYLSQHQNNICRRLHVIATTLIILLFIGAKILKLKHQCPIIILKN